MTTVLAPSKTSDDDKATVRLLCQRNLYYLAREVLAVHREPEKNHITPGFHRPMLLWSQTNRSPMKVHMVPRGYQKTTTLTVAKNIQRVLNNPEIRILIGSNKAGNAEDMLAEIKGHLESDYLQWLFPEILFKDPWKDAERWTRGQITVKRTRKVSAPTIDTNGVEGELTSKHYDHATFDDLVGLENSQTREERQKVIRWWQAAQSLLDPGTTQDYVATPWHYDDLSAWLLMMRKKGKIQFADYIVPCWLPCAGADARGTDVPGFGRVRPTFPERFPIPELLRIRDSTEMGTSRFSAQYLLKPTDGETAVFRRLEASPKQPYGIPAIKPTRTRPPADTLWLAMTIDPAISQKGWADYSALTVCGWDHENNQHVLWLRWGRWSETQLIAEAYRAVHHFAAKGGTLAVIAIEAVAFQKLYRHLFTHEGEKRGQFLPVTNLERDTKRTKNTRIGVLEPSWNAGELILYDDLDALDDLLDMAAKFRPETELTRDDLLDVLADNHQVRVRPHAPSAPALAGLELELADRITFEEMTQAGRTAAGHELLDTGSLRHAWLHKDAHARGMTDARPYDEVFA